jgi:hypothetical protein
MSRQETQPDPEEVADRPKSQLTPSGRGMGHKDRTVELRPGVLRSFKQHFGAARQGGGNGADFSAFVDRIRNQTSLSCCVGMGQARIIHVEAQLQIFGGPNPSAVPYPAELGIYGGAREEEFVDGTQTLTDDGSNPALALQFLQSDVGVPLERDWPFDESKVNEKLPAEVLANALSYKVQNCYEIDSDPSYRPDNLVQIFDSGHLSSMAFPVGDEYENCNSEAPVMPVKGQIYGGHDVPLVGYRQVPVNGTMRRQFKSTGSWGTSFGFGGYNWFDESTIADSRASDFIVIMVAPSFGVPKGVGR